ncbi:transmembrane protein 200A-like [Clupea harengus]|uniref:Transmembrane protein 200A-like n=1 Tax=Clupea harengus TaxID=7950 RepID=A0A6P8EU74_CLUHA|nr:transmembrane protein 200A-like [Clupea harengus]
MIATGGLLRISRRQDSLPSKTRAETKRRRRREKRKKKRDVVVVKGKLQVCSLSGLVAAVAMLVLLVGIAMAVLGYWPKDKPEYSETWAANNFQTTRGSQPRGSALLMAWNHTSNTKLGQQRALNLTRGNGTTLERSSPQAPAPLGILGELLASCLHSDQLKMYGPLVMGMGIFLFICANAVLHEDRDRQTKVIDLRDIYSTVIDAHSLRAKDQSPLNGLVNYIQGRSGAEPGVGDRASRSHGSWPSTLWGFGFGSGGGGGSRRPSCTRRCSWWHDGDGWSDTVYSVYQERDMGLAARPWETGSIVTSSLNAFTLPVIKLNNREMEEGPGGEEEEDARKVTQGGEEEWRAGSRDRPSFPIAIETKAEISRVYTSDSQSSLGTKRWGRGSSPRWSLSECGTAPQLLPPAEGRKVARSHLSLNSLSDTAGVRWAAGGRHDDRSRRFSCPRLDRSGSKGYIKLADLGGESFEGPDGGTLILGEEHAGKSVVAAASSMATVEVLVETWEVSQGERRAATSEHTLVEHTLMEHTPVHTQQPVAHPHAVVTCSPGRFSSAGGDH